MSYIIYRIKLCKYVCMGMCAPVCACRSELDVGVCAVEMGRKLHPCMGSTGKSPGVRL